MKPKIQKTTHEPQSSSHMVAASLVDDVLIEIFLRLPMKTLIRFKLVSKHWQSLISDPRFGILRNPNPNPATGLILQIPDSDPYAHIVSLDSSSSPRIRTLKCIDSWPAYDKATIQSSCNGLILMCGIYKRLTTSVFEYYVCNPTTNTYFALPQMPIEPDLMPLRSMYMAFDPTKSPHYKACALIYDRKSYWYQFLVYSSETGCWRKSCVEPFQGGNVDFNRGVYWNGAIHWVSYYFKTGKSLSFYPDDDRMSREMMPTPPILHSGSPYKYFGESCGHLHYIDKCWMLEMVLDVYELKRDYSEWFVKYRIHDPCFSVDRHTLILCAVVRGKSDDDSFSVFLIEGEFVRYNFLDKTHETICEVGGTPLEQCSPLVYLPLQHAESLCSV